MTLMNTRRRPTTPKYRLSRIRYARQKPTASAAKEVSVAGKMQRAEVFFHGRKHGFQALATAPVPAPGTPHGVSLSRHRAPLLAAQVWCSLPAAGAC